MTGSASPLNPSVAIASRSLSVASLEVACRVSARSTSSGAIPFFFFNDTATTEIYTLSLHDALPIRNLRAELNIDPGRRLSLRYHASDGEAADRKSTRLNSSHVEISYAVFCLKK